MVFFFVAVCFTARFGSVGAGLVAIGLSAGLAGGYVLQPAEGFAGIKPHLMLLGGYVAVSLMTVSVPNSDESVPCAPKRASSWNISRCTRATPNFFGPHKGRQRLREFFSHSSCTCGSLFGCLVSGATLRQS